MLIRLLNNKHTAKCVTDYKGYHDTELLSFKFSYD